MTAATASLTEGKAVSVMKGKLPVNDTSTTSTSIPNTTSINNNNNKISQLIPTPFDRAILVLFNNSEELVQPAVSILSKITSNIISHPNEEKYRKINKNNAAFSKKLGNINGGEGCLLALGFQIQGDEWVLVPSASAWDNLVNCQGKITRFATKLTDALKTGPLSSPPVAAPSVINPVSAPISNINATTTNTNNTSPNDIFAIQQFLTALQQTQNKSTQDSTQNNEDNDKKDKDTDKK
jgi:hypothetical protein